MIKSTNLVHVCGITLAILLSIGFMSYTSKLFSEVENLQIKKVNHIYDPDHDINTTSICILSKKIYKIPFENSTCFNKTLTYWYIPWIRNFMWNKLWTDAIARRKKLEKLEKAEESVIIESTPEPEIETITTTKTPEEIKEKPQEEKTKEKSSEVLYSILVGLLLLSALAAFWEVFKDKMKGDQGAGAKSQDKECSLADFTISRHLRRESQQHGGSHLQRQASFDMPAKVTQTLIHQSSLDRAFPNMISEVAGRELRRNSVPSYLVSDKFVSRNNPGHSIHPQYRTFRRQHSVDIPFEEISSEVRKKSRHFIRRH